MLIIVAESIIVEFIWVYQNILPRPSLYCLKQYLQVMLFIWFEFVNIYNYMLLIRDKQNVKYCYVEF